MLDDVKKLGAHLLGCACIIIKILTAPIVWLSAYVEKKQLPSTPEKTV